MSETDKEKLRTMLVEVLLELRSLYLRTSQANVLEHWRIILDRMQIAARTSGNIDEWVTSASLRLQIPQLGNSASSTLLQLSNFVRERDGWRVARTVVDRERGLLEALARKTVEEEKASRETTKEAPAS